MERRRWHAHPTVRRESQIQAEATSGEEEAQAEANAEADAAACADAERTAYDTEPPTHDVKPAAYGYGNGYTVSGRAWPLTSSS